MGSVNKHLPLRASGSPRILFSVSRGIFSKASLVGAKSVYWPSLSSKLLRSEAATAAFRELRREGKTHPGRIQRSATWSRQTLRARFIKAFIISEDLQKILNSFFQHFGAFINLTQPDGSLVLQKFEYKSPFLARLRASLNTLICLERATVVPVNKADQNPQLANCKFPVLFKLFLNLANTKANKLVLIKSEQLISPKAKTPTEERGDRLSLRLFTDSKSSVTIILIKPYLC